MSWAMDQLEARARRQLDSLNSVNELMAAVRITESSPDGEVRVEVDGMGALVDLVLSDRIARLSGKQLESLVVATANVACQKAFAQRAQIMQDFTEQFSGLIAPDGEPKDNPQNDGG